MSYSSGQDVSEFTIEVECGDTNDEGVECLFSGEVTAWEDPELAEWGWKCPDCGTEHFDGTEELINDEDEDYEWD